MKNRPKKAQKAPPPRDAARHCIEPSELIVPERFGAADLWLSAESSRQDLSLAQVLEVPRVVIDLKKCREKRGGIPEPSADRTKSRSPAHE